MKGAFDKGVQGIRNIQALSGGRTVVNVDIVINKQNVAHLRDIIDYFMAIGIHEFDLLYIVPFGRGFSEYRKQLYFNIEDHFEDLQRAFEVSRQPGVYIWTNRLPPEYLENYEDLIQDPHKLHSEVQGGLHNFEGFMKLGIAPDCHGERCQYCFLKGLCHDHMFSYRQMLVDGSFKRVRYDIESPALSQRAELVLASQKPAILHVTGESSDAIREWVADHPFRDTSKPELHIEPKQPSACGEFVSDASVDQLVVRDANTAMQLLAQPPVPDGPRLEVTLTGAAASWMLEHAETTKPWREAGRLVLHLPSFEYMSEVQENGVGPTELEALAAAGYVLMNVTPCLGGEKACEGVHDELSNGMLDAQGNLSVTPYVQRYIMGEYYKKSRRCEGCAVSDNCRGMHISFLRAHGFKSLKPLPDETGASGT